MAESKQREITIRGLEAPTMEALVNFAYSGRVSISTSNVQSLMMGASFLQLNRVRDACADFLTSRLSAGNVLGMRRFADGLGCQPLTSACDRFAHKFFAAIVEDDEFASLAYDELHALVTHDELHVTSEEVVFKAVMKWVKVDAETRKDKLADLLAAVRLPLMRPQFITDQVAAEVLIRSSHKCR